MDQVCDIDNPGRLVNVDINEEGHIVETYERPDGSQYTVEYLRDN